MRERKERPVHRFRRIEAEQENRAIASDFDRLLSSELPLTESPEQRRRLLQLYVPNSENS